MQPISHDKWNEPIIPDKVNTPANDELSSSSSPSPSLSLAKNVQENIKTRSHKRPLPHPTFNDAVSGASHRARREVGRRQNRPDQAPGNPPVLPSSTLPLIPLVPLAFGIVPMFYIPPAALIGDPMTRSFRP